MRKEGRWGRWEMEEGSMFMPTEADIFHPSSPQRPHDGTGLLLGLKWTTFEFAMIKPGESAAV